MAKNIKKGMWWIFEYKKQSKVDRSSRFEWYEESFDVVSDRRGVWQLPQSREFLNRLFDKKKLAITAFIFLGLLLTLFGRIVELQIFKGEQYALLAEENRIRIRPLVSERGKIYDSNGRELVQNIPTFSITISPSDIPRSKQEREAAVNSISKATNIPVDELRDFLKEFKNYHFEEIVLKENVDYESALKILIKSVDIPGLSIRQQSKREYAFYNTDEETTSTTPHSLSHVLGYPSKLTPKELEENYKLGYLPTDFIGRTGVESAYENFLRGSYGKKQVEVNALGVEQFVVGQEQPSPGRHIVLSIDVDAQNKLEEMLKKYLTINKKKRGSAIAVDPNSGSIIAMVSLPSFNSSMFARGISAKEYGSLIEDEDKPLFNRAISGMYPAGSVIKPLIAAAALEEGIISKNTSFLSTGGVEVGNRFFPDWKAGGHGITNVVKALSESVNTFFFIVGGGKDKIVGLGVNNINEYLGRFGLGQRHGIELPGEAAGRLPTPEWKEEIRNEPWYVGDTYNLSIGQGDLLVTPLQVAMYTAAIANGGSLYRPRLVQEVIDPVTNQKQIIEKRVLTDSIVKPYNIAVVKQGMLSCVQSGSCRAMQSLPITSAGKTGTAQWSKKHDTHAWFTSFAPYNDPEVVVTVLIEEGGEGSVSALPVARDFLEWWVEKYKEI